MDGAAVVRREKYLLFVEGRFTRWSQGEVLNPPLCTSTTNEVMIEITIKILYIERKLYHDPLYQK
jgi:hypothetical protein